MFVYLKVYSNCCAALRIYVFSPHSAEVCVFDAAGDCQMHRLTEDKFAKVLKGCGAGFVIEIPASFVVSGAFLVGMSPCDGIKASK